MHVSCFSFFVLFGGRRELPSFSSGREISICTTGQENAFFSLCLEGVHQLTPLSKYQTEPRSTGFSFLPDVVQSSVFPSFAIW